MSIRNGETIVSDFWFYPLNLIVGYDTLIMEDMIMTALHPDLKCNNPECLCHQERPCEGDDCGNISTSCIITHGDLIEYYCDECWLIEEQKMEAR